MSQAEELRQLREHIRQDVKDLHARFDATMHEFHMKLDAMNNKNNSDHEKLSEKIAHISQTSEVKAAVLTTKVGLFVAFLSMVVASTVSWAIGKL